MDDDRLELCEALKWCCERLHSPTFTDEEARKIAATAFWVSQATAGERDVLEAMLHRLAETCLDLLTSLVWRNVPDVPAVWVDLDSDVAQWRSAMRECEAQIDGGG